MFPGAAAPHKSWEEFRVRGGNWIVCTLFCKPPVEELMEQCLGEEGSGGCEDEKATWFLWSGGFSYQHYFVVAVVQKYLFKARSERGLRFIIFKLTHLYQNHAETKITITLPLGVGAHPSPPLWAAPEAGRARHS